MTHNDSQVEVAPCPFCGGHPAFDSTDERTRLHCSGCGSEGGLFFFSQEECESGIGDATEARAIAAWNRRTALSALAAGKVEAKPVPCPGIDERAAAWDAWFQQWQSERSYKPLTGDSFDAGYRLAWKRAHAPSPLSADPESAVVGAQEPHPLASRHVRVRG